MAAPSILGQRVLQRRQELDLTQAALAQAVGVQVGTIARLEQGVTQEVTTATLGCLSTALDVSTDWLLGRIDDAEEAARREARSRRNHNPECSPSWMFTREDAIHEGRTRPTIARLA